ncbi:MAG: hypothetical protein JWM09_128 [Francisellaceae bacterium]|nr:hypothetical protein [Francisellaceae bacterium]
MLKFSKESQAQSTLIPLPPPCYAKRAGQKIAEKLGATIDLNTGAFFCAVVFENLAQEDKEILFEKYLAYKKEHPLDAEEIQAQNNLPPCISKKVCETFLNEMDKKLNSNNLYQLDAAHRAHFVGFCTEQLYQCYPETLKTLLDKWFAEVNKNIASSKPKCSGCH